MKSSILVSVIFIASVVTANLLLLYFGPWFSIINAFVFIGLDIVCRDYLHEKWVGKNLFPKMALIILAGGFLTHIINSGASQIALGSFVAFVGANLTDSVVYQWLIKKKWLLKVNGSNVAASAVDSILFPLIAFSGIGLAIIPIATGQFLAKVFGGFLWSFVFSLARKKTDYASISIR